MIQVTDAPRANWRFLTIAAALVSFAYVGLPIAFWLCRAASPLDRVADGLGTVAIAAAGLTLAYVFAGAPVVTRLLARDLQRLEPSPVVRAERLLARLHIWVWGAVIVALPAYVAYIAIP
jgi:ABC-type sulfate transport system permease component